MRFKLFLEADIIKLLSKKIEKLKKKHGFVATSMLTRKELEQLAGKKKPIKISEAANRYMITDMGKGYPIKVDFEMVDAQGKPTNMLNRFGVWTVIGNTAKEVIDTGNDLKKLQKKYNVSDDMVVKIGKGPF